VEAVIGIRDVGKTKKPPDAQSLHSEPMGDGLRLRFRKYQSDFKHLPIQSSAVVALPRDGGTRGPNDGPHSHQTCIRLRRKTRPNRSAGIPDRGAFVGVHDAIVSEIKPDGSTK